MVLIAAADIIVIQIQVSLFCYLHTGMTKDLTEGIDVHAVHKAAFCKVISEAVGRIVFIQAAPKNVLFKVVLKVSNAYAAAVFFDREEVVTFNITIFKLQPSPQYGFCSGREKDGPVFSAFGFFCSETDPSSGKLQVCNQERGAFTQPHSGIQHKQDHDIIPVL